MTNQTDLFSSFKAKKFRENRRSQCLFLPEILESESLLQSIAYKNKEEAYEIISKWSDLEEDGKIFTRKETNIEAEFITEIFGKALGYKLFSDNLESWELEQKYRINGQECDAVLGNFSKDSTKPIAIIELKGPNVNLDKDRFNGRTAVQQCWDYMNLMPECPWGIVSNIVSFRLYHRDHSPRKYELFFLNELINQGYFSQFFYLFHRDGLLLPSFAEKSRAIQLLEKSINRQEEIGDELYVNYNYNRERLVSHLTKEPLNKDLNQAIAITQKLLDRIIFIAFCEDRGLLPQNTISKAHDNIFPFDKVTNPRWRNFKDLFQSIDSGNQRANISPFNGGLFKEDPEVDNLELDDRWTDFFHSIGKYDFNSSINVEILGHLFERSINDLEKLRLKGLFNLNGIETEAPKMSKSGERKKGGIYYTPPGFTDLIVIKTLRDLIEDRFRQIQLESDLKNIEIFTNKPCSKAGKFWRSCFEILRQISVLDPACGSGAFLIKAFDILEERYLDVLDHLEFHDKTFHSEHYNKVSEYILNNNLHGVDIVAEAVEIAQLALWIRSAQLEKSLADLSRNIICGNSLITDKTVDGKAVIWEEAFPNVFTNDNSGFDCIIGNPPWERIKLQEREYFDAIAPQIGSAVSAAKRRSMIKNLESESPEAFHKYQLAKTHADEILTYIRTCDRFPLTGKGDINYYSLFAELAKMLISPNGRVGLLIPSGIATDFTNRDFFSSLISTDLLLCFYDFENKAAVFPDVHRSFKFSVLIFNGENQKTESSDFVFFSRETSDLTIKNRHIRFSKTDFETFNPNTLTCPIFRSERDAKITRNIYHQVPILINHKRDDGGNPWGIRFIRMFDQTNDAEFFVSPKKLKDEGFKLDGNRWLKDDKVYLPLYEGKSFQAYDHRAASIVIKDANWFRQGQTSKTWDVSHQDPTFSISPRWHVDLKKVIDSNDNNVSSCYLAFKNVTSPTNIRTMIAAFIPFSAVSNSAPIIFTGNHVERKMECCLLANLNSYILDFIARQKVGGVNLNFYIIEQLPILPPDFYQKNCPWEKDITLEEWISERVLKLTCTSNDMIPFAEEAGFEPKVHKWDAVDRQDLMAQIDAAYFHFYGIDRDTVCYILSTFSRISESGSSIFETESITEKILRYFDEYRN